MATQTAFAAAIDAGIDFTGGTLGGIATVFVGQPLDTIKVKLQTYPQLYRSTYHCFRNTLNSEGLSKGLYRGTIPSLAANIAENSVLFCAYGMCQTAVAKVVGKDVSNLDTVHNASAGFFAAFFSSFTLCPTELIKCRLQTLAEASKSGTAVAHQTITPWQLTRQIIRQEGFLGLFNGLSSTWLREMPGYFVFFGGYEYTRSLFCKAGQSKDDIGMARTALAGGVGGCCLWLVIFPADLVKSRIQVLSSLGDKLNFRTVFKHVLLTEGVIGLYSGIVPTLIRTVPATAALFVTYESTKRLLGDFLKRDDTISN
ncbi:mitochondrial ornithine transporter 1-like [Watersipora subatra]|uniref:mitochondrial ornithine transporter 1-like n=1 Tax=Watersipora subatra TaxID=2589382 RepID=UPI00355B817F